MQLEYHTRALADGSARYGVPVAIRRRQPAYHPREEVAAALDRDEREQEDADEDEIWCGRHGRSLLRGFMIG